MKLTVPVLFVQSFHSVSSSLFFVCTAGGPGDSLVERPEFIARWISKGLGDAESASFLFAHADTDHDGSISNSPDLIRVFKYFDLNGQCLNIYGAEGRRERECVGWWGWREGQHICKRSVCVCVCVCVCCLLYTSPSPRDRHASRMPSSA